jgi:hypothetical protein
MDLLTVVFTGLIIFEPPGAQPGVEAPQTVHLVKAKHHQMRVYVRREGQTTIHVVKKALKFDNVGTGPVGKAPGFALPILGNMFVGRDLSVNAQATIKFPIKGGTLGPYRSHTHCMVEAVGKAGTKIPMVFWEGAVWSVEAGKGAALTVDGDSIDLDNKALVHISNDYTGDDHRDHRKVYGDALNEHDVRYSEPICEDPYPNPEKGKSLRGETGILNHNPITCPPVSLR